ncbi:MAG: hypothetical protein DRJ61_03325 [Acidobacteria bacterium]|nr:MAG: hypothetical protein DRJ61_03325 [Acidobacteriota bacterium]
MTKVLLITPYGYQNTGIRLLSATLREGEFEAPILFMKAWRNNDIQPPTEDEFGLLQDFVKKTVPDIIGIGFGTPYLKIVSEMTGRLREVSGAHIIWGGVHPTIAPEDCIEIADSVCVGEGERPLLDLARAFRDGTPIEETPNLWIRTPEGVRKNRPRQLLQNLDALPYAHLAEAEMASIEDGQLRHGNPSKDNVLYRIFASRGCPFACSFCYNSQFRQIFSGLGRYHRTRTVESVMKELEASVARLPKLRRIRFDDDTFVFPSSWIKEFVGEYTRRIGLPFDILLNPQAANEETLRLLKEAGLVHVQVGIQSGSEDEVEEHFSREGSNAQTLGLARLLNDIGIEVTYDLILDNPLATRRDKEAMIDLLLQLPRPFALFIYSLTNFPKSEITDNLLEMGLISPEEVEGRATKSFEQFRLSLGYPRPAEETFFASLISMTSKGFIPGRLIKGVSRNTFLREHPAPVRWAAEAANVIKLAGVAFRMMRRGELSAFKIAEYASFKRRLIQ